MCGPLDLCKVYYFEIHDPKEACSKKYWFWFTIIFQFFSCVPSLECESAVSTDPRREGNNNLNNLRIAAAESAKCNSDDQVCCHKNQVKKKNKDECSEYSDLGYR